MSVSKGQHHYRPVKDSADDIGIMNKIDIKFADNQTIGVIKMTEYLKLDGYWVGYRRIGKFMRKMGYMHPFHSPI